MRLRSGATTRNHDRISKRRIRMTGSRSSSTSTNVNEDNVGLTNASSMPATTIYGLMSESRNNKTLPNMCNTYQLSTH